MYINRIWLWHLKTYLVYCGWRQLFWIEQEVNILGNYLCFMMISFKKVEKKMIRFVVAFFHQFEPQYKIDEFSFTVSKNNSWPMIKQKKAWTVIISSTLNLLGRRIIINNTTSVSSKWHKKQIWWVFFMYQYLDLEKQLRPKMTRQKWYAPREKSVSKKLYIKITDQYNMIFSSLKEVL